MDVGTGLARARAERPADRMERRSREFHEKVRQGYLALAERSPDRIKAIKVMEDMDRTYDLVKEEVYGLIERHKGAE